MPWCTSMLDRPVEVALGGGWGPGLRGCWGGGWWSSTACNTRPPVSDRQAGDELGAACKEGPGAWRWMGGGLERDHGDGRGGGCPQLPEGLTLGAPRVKGFTGTVAIRKVREMKEASSGCALGPLVTLGDSYKSPRSSLL